MTYYMKSAMSQISILAKRQSIERALSSDSLTESEKNKIRLAQQVREFAKSQLDLDISGNFSSFVQLGRPYVTYVVSASPPWKLENYEWDYLIVGKMPYKGFTSLEDANEEAELLQKKDLETYVRGVSAYSTLGWFKDPILSSMLKYSDWDFVDTIIHETVHSNIYIKNNADFNEQLAVFLGEKGMELFYLHKEGPQSETLQKAKAEAADSKIFRKFMSAEFKKMEGFYNQIPPDFRTDEIKQSYFHDLKKNFEKDVKPKLKTNSYDLFFEKDLNNAKIMLYATYNKDLSDFEDLYYLVGHDFKAFMNEIKKLEKSKDPSADLKKMTLPAQQ